MSFSKNSNALTILELLSTMKFPNQENTKSIKHNQKLYRQILPTNLEVLIKFKLSSLSKNSAYLKIENLLDGELVIDQMSNG